MVAFISQLLHGLANGYPISTLFLAIAIGLVLQYYIRINSKPDPTLPPVVPYFFPFFGSMVTYGMNPVQFLKENQKIVSFSLYKIKGRVQVLTRVSSTATISLF